MTRGFCPAFAGHVTAWAGRADARFRVDFYLGTLLRSVSVKHAELRRAGGNVGR